MVKNRFTAKGYTGQTPLRFCPVCFHKLDGVTNLTGSEKPEPGDFTICIGCTSVLKFTTGNFELSSLEAVPVYLRFEFAKVIRLMKENPPPLRSENYVRRDNVVAFQTATPQPKK
jgi:hypothetical protein